MTVWDKQRAVRWYRGQIPSPGRPTVAWREDRVRFWAAIERGLSSEEAAAEIDVSSAVGTRWFRHAGGVRPNLATFVSARYLSFREREDIAIWRAQDVGAREIARRLGRSPSTISHELRRNASTRTYRLDYRASVAQWHAERRARRPRREAGRQRALAHVRAGPGGARAPQQRLHCRDVPRMDFRAATRRTPIRQKSFEEKLGGYTTPVFGAER